MSERSEEVLKRVGLSSAELEAAASVFVTAVAVFGALSLVRVLGDSSTTSYSFISYWSTQRTGIVLMVLLMIKVRPIPAMFPHPRIPSFHCSH